MSRASLEMYLVLQGRSSQCFLDYVVSFCGMPHRTMVAGLSSTSPQNARKPDASSSVQPHSRYSPNSFFGINLLSLLAASLSISQCCAFAPSTDTLRSYSHCLATLLYHFDRPPSVSHFFIFTHVTLTFTVHLTALHYSLVTLPNLCFVTFVMRGVLAFF